MALTLAVLALLGVDLAGAQPSDLTNVVQAGCGFHRMELPADVNVVGPENVLSILRIRRQPDMPAAVISADFSSSVIEFGPGNFDWKGGFALRIENRSNAPILEFRYLAQLTSTGGGGVGRAGRYRGRLLPGDRIDFQARGYSNGVNHKGEFAIEVLLTELLIEGCGRPIRAGSNYLEPRPPKR